MVGMLFEVAPLSPAKGASALLFLLLTPAPEAAPEEAAATPEMAAPALPPSPLASICLLRSNRLSGRLPTGISPLPPPLPL